MWSGFAHLVSVTRVSRSLDEDRGFGSAIIRATSGALPRILSRNDRLSRMSSLILIVEDEQDLVATLEFALDFGREASAEAP